MNIVILQGSPNIKGSTNLLVESFTKGANESGHNVKRFDICNMGINPCNGCVACGYKGPCVIDDDWTFESLETHYKTLVRYNHFENKGMILGKGCGTPSMTQNSKYMQEAYELGKNI